MPTLDLTSLRNALLQLEEGCAKAKAQPLEEIIRDGVIQRYEYSYELCIKFIRRALETSFGETGADQMLFKELLRTAAERGLIQDPLKWFRYREERNRTAHTYDANVAAIVYAAAEQFLSDARFLLSRLEQISD